MTVFIYALCCPFTGEIRYIGKAINVRKRFYCHWHDKERTPKTNWISSLKRKGEKPVMQIVEEIPNSNDEDWQEVERFWISYLRFLGCRLTNLQSGGDAGKRLSEETRLKMRQSSLGKKMSAASREKMRANNIGRKRGPHRPETIEKIRRSNMGKTRSPEHCAKLSASLKGIKQSKRRTPEQCAAISARLKGKKIPLDVVAKQIASRAKNLAALRSADAQLQLL